MKNLVTIAKYIKPNKSQIKPIMWASEPKLINIHAFISAPKAGKIK